MVAEPEYERVLFTGFRNLVIEQFEYEPGGSVSIGNLQIFVGATHRPAGLLSTEMSKKVRFLVMVAVAEAEALMANARRMSAVVGAYRTGTERGLEAVICERKE